MFFIKNKHYIFFLFFTITSFSQRIISGKVIGSNQIYLERANVIANPLSKNDPLKFNITNSTGDYKINLDNTKNYEIIVSYLGYYEEKINIEPDNKDIFHTFILKEKENKLNEVVIKYEYKPIEIKKDTVTFNVNSFANGTEKKLKEVLEKIPGVEVEKNGNVFYQGKQVTTTTVQDKIFFNGRSKLAVENIPSDVVDKIEFIDHFSRNNVLKQVNDSDDLAMNIKLKKNEQNFVFGDVEGGAEIANDNDFHLLHSGLFYYSPKTSANYIGDLNSIGRSFFSFEDIMSFDSSSSFLSTRKPLSDLYSFANDNKDVSKNKSLFSALNINTDIKKINIDGFCIFTKSLIESNTVSNLSYFQNTNFSNENRNQIQSESKRLGIFNIKLKYERNKDENWFYNTQLQFSDFHETNSLNIKSPTLNTILNNIVLTDNFSFKNYGEWNKNINKKQTVTFVANYEMENNIPNKNWSTNQPFLSGLIPLQTDSYYLISQTKRIRNNNFDSLFKHYWIVTNQNHLYSYFGAKIWNTDLFTNDEQLLTNGTINNFNTADFNNSLKYNLNDFYVGFEDKFRWGNLIIKPAIYFHQFYLNVSQNNNTTINKFIIQPELNSEYNFDESTKLLFNYKLNNSFAEANDYQENYVLQSYNSVFKGNALLRNETYHSSKLYFYKRATINHFSYFSNLTFMKKTKALRNELLINGINQYSTPILTDNPETTWRFDGNISKKLYQFNLSLNTSLNWFKYSQNLNNLLSVNNRTSQNIKLKLRTANKKWPDFLISYSKGFSQLDGLTISKNKNDNFESSLNIIPLKNLVFKMDYNFTNNQNNSDKKVFFQIANTSLIYRKKNSSLSIEVLVNNIFNTKSKNDIRISDYYISESTMFVLPRTSMLNLTYKL